MDKQTNKKTQLHYHLTSSG